MKICVFKQLNGELFNNTSRVNIVVTYTQKLFSYFYNVG